MTRAKRMIYNLTYPSMFLTLYMWGDSFTVFEEILSLFKVILFLSILLLVALSFFNNYKLTAIIGILVSAFYNLLTVLYEPLLSELSETIYFVQGIIILSPLFMCLGRKEQDFFFWISGLMRKCKIFNCRNFYFTSLAVTAIAFAIIAIFWGKLFFEFAMAVCAVIFYFQNFFTLAIGYGREINK